MALICLNFREEDAQAADRLRIRLEARLGTGQVTTDARQQPGMAPRLQGCRLLVVVIGTGWLAGDQAKRLQLPDDPVRLEIEQAMRLPAVRIVPLLVGGATLAAAALPASLASLAAVAPEVLRRHATAAEVDALADSLATLAKASGPRPTRAKPPEPGDPGGSSLEKLPRPNGGTRGITRSPPAAGPPGQHSGIAVPPAPPSPTPEKSEPPADASQVQCHIVADMDPEVVVDQTATIVVTLSREEIHALAGRASSESGPVAVAAGTPLLVQVLPRVNFVLGDGANDRFEVAVPAEQKPIELFFDVKGAHPGAGEVWIVVRQHQMSVARLVLRPSVVERPSAAAPPRMTATADAVAAPPLDQPLDQLTIFEQTVGDTVKYVFELEMHSYNLFGLYESLPLKGKRDDYISALYKEIENRYVSVIDTATRTADVTAFTAELQAYGATLFDQLCPREVQDALWTHRHTLNSVRVVSTEPFIPWEIVHPRPPGQPLDPAAEPRFLGQMGLVRWLYNVNGLPPVRLRLRPGRVRYVIPKYSDPQLQLPATVNERVYLQKTFQATPIEPQPNPLRQALATPGSFDLIHFACHGEAESNTIAQARILLEGRMEGEFVPTYLNATTVETFARLKGADGSQPIVFLNACQAGRAGYQLTGIGGFAQAFLRAGAGAFVGTLWSVGDQPAFFFGKAFYESLRNGKTVAEAAIAAREAARRDDATWLAYVVYAHPHGTATQA